ncbi:biotin--[acetyl-CoA-carboxylase] ligase [Falsiroseomonas sp. CW058]|uniref:biotin--[acetyl-CoA-carboxylase] ligase n=1 Tax=Falsiroseomonas sp. CW058 TaxID=3388664 RepID=UPI003D31A161
MRLPDGFRLDARGAVGSTNDEAKALAAAGAPHGTVVWAGTQHAGRGRHGRTWQSLPGNLHVSLLLRPAVPLARAPELGFVGALAAADAVDALLAGAGRAGLKWPNDLLLDGAKLGGILCEAGAAGGMLGWLVMGIGLNLAAAPPEAPYPVTSLAARGRVVKPAAALPVVVAAVGRWMERWRDGFDPLRSAWVDRAGGAGREMAVRHDGGLLRGRLVGLDHDGALLLGTDAGVRRVAMGEVEPPRAAPLSGG